MNSKLNQLLLKRLRDNPDGSPKHVVIYRGVIDAIESQTVQANEKLPTESEWTQQLPVSLGTVQRAVRSLMLEGWVRRKRGHGTYVVGAHQLLENPLHLRFVGPEGFLPVYATLLKRQSCSETGPWSLALRQEGRNLLRIDRKISIDHTFSVLSRILVNADRFPFLADCPAATLSNHNIKLLLSRHHGVEVSRIEQSMQMMAFPPVARKVTGLRVGEVGTRLDLMAVQTNAEVALYQELYIPPNPYRLVVSDQFTPQEHWDALAHDSPANPFNKSSL